MKRPAVPLALVFAGGLLIGDRLPVSPGVLLPLCFVLLFVATAGLAFESALARAGAAMRLCVWPLVFCGAWANLSCRTLPLAADDLRNLQLNSFEIVSVRGVLLETPSQRVYVRDENESYRWISSLELKGIQRDKRGWQTAAGKILVTTPGLIPQGLFGGQEVEVAGVLGQPPQAAAEGLFDYRAYLRRSYVYFQLKTQGTNDWVLRSPVQNAHGSDRFLAWAQRTLARGLPREDQPLRMLWAMTLGWKTIDNRVYQPFMQSGTMHIFAISGLHIALIAGICVALLRVVRIPRLWCGLLVVPLIWFYTGATGWQASAIRSTVMMSTIIGAWALWRPTDLLNSLAVAAFCILVWDPQQLFGASFQLSFFVVLSLAVLLPPLEEARDRWLRTDPLLPAALVPGWGRGLLLGARWFTSSMAISLAACIGSLPLTAYYFHLVSPVTLLANLVVVPLSSLALACNLGSLICGSWLSPMTELFNHSAWFWMNSMIHLSNWAAHTPGGFWYVPAPPRLLIAIYYLIAAGLVTGRLFAGSWRRGAYAAGALVVLVAGWYFYDSRASSTVAILPVNGGFVVHAHHPGEGPDLLVDVGRSNGVEQVTLPYLRGRGLNRLPGLVLTHGDIRHVEGTERLLSELPARKVYCSGVRFRSTAYRRVIKDLGERPGLVQVVERESRIGPWTVLHPDREDRFAAADDTPLVLYGRMNGNSVLLLSDLGRAGQTALVERYPELQADIVVTGIALRGEAVSPGLLRVVRPKLVVVADSEFPVAERASASLRERLARAGIRVVYTRFSGATTLELNSGGWRVRTMDGQEVDSRSPGPGGGAESERGSAPGPGSDG